MANGMADDAKFFNNILLKKKVDVDFYISPCKLIERERKTNKLRFAHVAHKPSLLCCSSDVWKQPTARRRGLIAHEIGHMLLMKKGNYDHAEHEADQEVKKVLGLTVKYDRKGLQNL